MQIARTFVVCAELAAALLLPGVFAGVAGAQIPRTLSYQGVLADSSSTPRPDGDYSFIFRLYVSGSGGSAIWTESKTLTLKTGLFHTVLGDQTPIGPSVAFDKPYWLGIQVGGSGEMSPRTPLSSVGYSFSSIWADSALAVRDSSLLSRKIARGQVVRSLNGLHDAVTLQVADGATLFTSSDGVITLTAGPVVRSVNGLLGNVTLQGEGGTTVTSSDNTITIGTLTAPGMGIQEIQNTDGTLSITDAVGPTTTVNMAVPLQLDNSSSDPLMYVTNSGGGEAGWFDSYNSLWPTLVAYGANQSAAVFWSDDPTHNAIEVSAVPGGTAAAFKGHVSVTGDLRVGGRVEVAGDLYVWGTTYGPTPALKIDHPLAPTTKYLVQSSVSSPDMMNVYNGDVVLDASGEAWVDLPDYLEALNRDFRYQLTAVGAPGPNLYVAEKVANHRFRIAGGTPGLEVSWQITGIRKDPWAEANRIVVEPEKAPADQGRYLHPEVYGNPAEMAIGRQQAPSPRLSPATDHSTSWKARLAEIRARVASPTGGR
jgi:hypothetical protein